MSYEKQLFETDSGEMYYTDELGNIFRIDFQSKEDKKKRIYTTFLETKPNYKLE